MSQAEHVRVGYILKRFPRFSETFILTEVLAHQAAGLDLEILALRTPEDDLVHGGMSRLDRKVTYVPTDFEFGEFMLELEAAQAQFPGLRPALEREQTRGLDFLDVYQAIWVARAAHEKGFTHLHAHFGSVATTVTRFASRITGIPYSFTAHAKDIFHKSVNADDLSRKLADATAAVAISDYNLTHLLENCGPVAGRVRRVYNGLDLDQFRYSAPDGRPPRIVGIGRLIEKKGFSDLIAACAVLAGQGRDFHCEIIGTGLLERELRAQVDQFGLSERVHLLGVLSQEEVIEHVKGASVLAAPCVEASDGDMDGLPTVLLEAMALGTPCVSTNVTGIPEVLKDGITGLMTPQHDPRALAAAISRLLDDAGLRVRLAGQARRLIETEFDSCQNSARVRELFTADKPARELVAERSA